MNHLQSIDICISWYISIILAVITRYRDRPSSDNVFALSIHELGVQEFKFQTARNKHAIVLRLIPCATAGTSQCSLNNVDFAWLIGTWRKPILPQKSLQKSVPDVWLLPARVWEHWARVHWETSRCLKHRNTAAAHKSAYAEKNKRNYKTILCVSKPCWSPL